MERLTDRKTAEELKANAESLRELGFEPSILDKRYIKLAEYENAEELIKTTTRAPVLSYQTAVIKALLEGKGVKCKVKYEKPKLYLCDADKRPQCRATACYKNGGGCKLTQHKEFARTDENGNAIEYKGVVK